MWLAPLNPRLDQWSGRRVWLIGCSSGIGAAVAQGLLDRDAHVALSARRRDRLESLARAHPNALVLPMDASQAGAWATAHAWLRARWDTVDLVIFCAARYQPERSGDIRADSVQQTIATNLTSVYYGLEAILPEMLQKKAGSVAIVASVAGYLGLPSATVYGPTKAALINLAELLYTELHPRGLGVYLINPGFVRSELTARNSFSMPALLSPEQAADHILRGLARGRFEIDFPWRFTRVLRLVSMLPYRWRFALMRRALGMR